MSGSYWYDRLPDLLAAEKRAMKQFFPQFKLKKLSDGRLYWVGSVNPRGKYGGVWTLMAIYNHDHPSNAALYGSSVRIYSIKPELEELVQALGEPLPHVLRDSDNKLYICSSRREDVAQGTRDGNGSYEVTSAASSLGWAVKWIWLFEGWLNGEISHNDLYGHVY